MSQTSTGIAFLFLISGRNIRSSLRVECAKLVSIARFMPGTSLMPTFVVSIRRASFCRAAPSQ